MILDLIIVKKIPFDEGYLNFCKVNIIESGIKTNNATKTLKHQISQNKKYQPNNFGGILCFSGKCTPSYTDTYFNENIKHYNIFYVI